MSAQADGPRPPAGDPTLVTWFRQDVRRAVWVAWSRAFALVLTAMLVLALPMGFDAEQPWALIGWIIGAICLVSGPTYLIFRLQRVLGPDIFLAVHHEGLRWHGVDEERLVAWERIERVEPNPGGDGIVVVVEPGAGGALVIRYGFTDVSQALIVDYLNEQHRKALMGLRLHPPRR